MAFPFPGAVNHAVFLRGYLKAEGALTHFWGGTVAPPSFSPNSRIKSAAFFLWCHVCPLKVCWKTVFFGLFRRSRNVSPLLRLSYCSPRPVCPHWAQTGKPQLPVTYFDLVLFSLFLTSGCRTQTCTCVRPAGRQSLCDHCHAKACWEVYLAPRLGRLVLRLDWQGGGALPRCLCICCRNSQPSAGRQQVSKKKKKETSGKGRRGKKTSAFSAQWGRLFHLQWQKQKPGALNRSSSNLTSKERANVGSSRTPASEGALYNTPLKMHLDVHF